MEQVEKTTETKPKKSKVRMILVIAFILIFLLVSYISLRSEYLEFKELGENFEQVFFTNLKYRFIIIGISFVVLYWVMYFTNRSIKKGLKEFFDKDEKAIPRLPNKSISLVFSSIAGALIGTSLMEKVILFTGNTSFGTVDPIFNLDIGYYMFQKPLIESIIIYAIIITILLIVYSIVYHVLVFNICLKSVDGQMIRNGYSLKKIIRKIKFLAVELALITIFNTQNMLFEGMLTINGNTEIVGAGYIQSTIKLWGYIIFAIVIVISIFRATTNFKKGNNRKILHNIMIIPIYLVALFIVTIGFDGLFVSSNKLDKEDEYLQYNIDSTKQAYNINIEEKSLEYSGTLTQDDVSKNQNVIKNIAIVSKDAVLKSLNDGQTEKGYYTYSNVNLAKYKIEDDDKIVYVAPREVADKEKTYNNKTYEYTHAQGVVIADSTTTTEEGNVQYIQKDVTGEDQKINISQPRMYFGLESKDIIATNVKDKKEFDYEDVEGKELTTSYDGEAGLKLGFLDKLVLGITHRNLNLAFSGDITDESKILLNRNVLDRAKKALPYLIYDENPYTVITGDGRIVWVIDGYTRSNQYPYSKYTTIYYGDSSEKVNYIRNSIKVLIDSYSGEVSYYITDRTDPIAMAYEKIYPSLFKGKDEKIPDDIAKHLIYPQYLYDIQANVLEVYHDVKTDVLYREDDIWQIAKFNTSNVSKATGTKMDSYYTMIKDENNENKLGLLQIYNPKDKQNIISYLVGVTEGDTNKLTLYKFSQDSNTAGPMQLQKQIEADEAISSQIESINVSGTKITKQMIVVPINNTLLYVEPIYQTMLNEESDAPILKKVIVASGNKVAMGDNFSKALQNLLSQNAVDIEIENTDDIDSLIEAIIKSNNNLSQSRASGNWELMGKDIEKLQSLIKSLEILKLREEQREQAAATQATPEEVLQQFNTNTKNEIN